MLGFALFLLGFALFFNCFRCGGLLLESGGCCTSLVFLGFACFSKAAGCIPEPGALWGGPSGEGWPLINQNIEFYCRPYC